MNDPFESAISAVLDHEGRTYTNRPNDKGGPTKFGITIATLSAYRKHAVTPEDVANLTENEARGIYHDMFWEPFDFDSLPDDELAVVLFDQGINGGVVGVFERLQKVLGVKIDGKLGPITIAAIRNEHPQDVAFRFLRAQAHHYTDIVKRDPTQVENFGGWIDRIFSLLDYVSGNF